RERKRERKRERERVTALTGAQADAEARALQTKEECEASITSAREANKAEMDALLLEFEQERASYRANEAESQVRIAEAAANAAEQYKKMIEDLREDLIAAEGRVSKAEAEAETTVNMLNEAFKRREESIAKEMDNLRKQIQLGRDAVLAERAKNDKTAGAAAEELEQQAKEHKEALKKMEADAAAERERALSELKADHLGALKDALAEQERQHAKAIAVLGAEQERQHAKAIAVLGAEHQMSKDSAVQLAIKETEEKVKSPLLKQIDRIKGQAAETEQKLRVSLASEINLKMEAEGQV
ncbi:hypothetical protein KIPB_011375, partial [Kipferlia bialata]